MARLIKVVETIELSTMAEAEKLIAQFKEDDYPKLQGYRIIVSGSVFLLEAAKVYDENVQESWSSRPMEKPDP